MNLSNMRLYALCILAVLAFQQVGAQSLLRRVDSLLKHNYYKNNYDTAYIIRPQQKWTLRGNINVSGTKIETKGVDSEGKHFHSEMTANHKATVSLGVSYLGISVSLSLNPAKLLGRYSDYELSFNSYGKRFGFDFTYQDARNFTGWHDHEGMERIDLPEDVLKVKTLNANAYYIFNHRRFSYPAALTQNYIQRHSAGSFMLAASVQAQHAFLDWEEGTELKMTNIALGAGYGYNYVPGRGWLLHISALPTFIVYSRTSMTFGKEHVPLHYHFPEVIITGRGAVVRQNAHTFYGLSMKFNFTNIGNENSLVIHNIKWRIRTFFGVRL